MSNLKLTPQDRQSIDFAEQERIRFENNGKKDRAVVDASNLSEENKESWKKAVSLLKGALCLQTGFDQHISTTRVDIHYNKTICSIGNGITYENGNFIVGKGISAIKFTIDFNFYNMTNCAYFRTFILKNNTQENHELWAFFDSGLSGGFSQTILLPCKEGDVFKLQGETQSYEGYLNSNTYINVEVF